MFCFEVNLVYWFILMFDVVFVLLLFFFCYFVVVVVCCCVFLLESVDVYKRVLMVINNFFVDWLMMKDYYDGI